MGASSPNEWAQDKALKLRRYAVSDVARWTRAARDVMMPGVPVAMLLGVAANGGERENTTGWKSCSDSERAEALMKGRKPLGGDPRTGYGRVDGDDLHELGPYGVEAGHVPGEVAGVGTPWEILGRTEGVRKALGRDAVTGSAWYSAVADQCVIGVATLAQHAHRVREKLRAIDPRLAWDEDGDGGPKAWRLWALMMGVSGWSAGDTGIARHVGRYATTLAAVPEAERWGAFLRCAAGYDGDGNKHARPSYTALRGEQKRAGGLLAVPLIADEPWAAAWLDDGLAGDRAKVHADLVRSARVDAIANRLDTIERGDGPYRTGRP